MKIKLLFMFIGIILLSSFVSAYQYPTSNPYNAIYVWHFNDSITDSINSVDITTTGSSTYNVGVYGNAINYTAANSHGHSGTVNIKNTTFTMCMWVNPNAYLASAELGSIYIDANNRITFSYNNIRDIRMYSVLNGNACDITAVGTILVNESKWSHLCVTLDNTNQTLYVNGDTIMTKLCGFGADDLQGVPTISIGDADVPDATYTPTAAYDDILLFNYSLSRSNIWDLYNGNVTTMLNMTITSIYLTSSTPVQQLYSPYLKGNTSDDTPSFNVMTDKDANCSYSLNNATWTLCESTGLKNHTCTQSAVSDGDYIQYFKCQDSDSSYYLNVTVLVDSSYPTITFISPEYAFVQTEAHNYTVNFSVSDPYLDIVNLTIYDHQNYSVVYNMNWTDLTVNNLSYNYTLTLNNGSFDVEVCASDSLTNSPLKPYYTPTKNDILAMVNFADLETLNNIDMRVFILDDKKEKVSHLDRDLKMFSESDGRHIKYGGVLKINPNEFLRFQYHSNNPSISFIEKGYAVGHIITSDRKLYFHHNDMIGKGFFFVDDGFIGEDYYIDFKPIFSGLVDFDPISGGLNSQCVNHTIYYYEFPEFVAGGLEYVEEVVAEVSATCQFMSVDELFSSFTFDNIVSFLDINVQGIFCTLSTLVRNSF